MEDAILIDPGLDFQQEIEPDIHFTGDKDLIRQAILNVVSNAIKYNRVEGFVNVSVRLFDEAVEIEITNAGDAIPADCAAKLFDRFFRGERARQAQKEGRGLGLSLAREFIRAHKGTLSLVRNETDAISFLIHLPTKAI